MGQQDEVGVVDGGVDARQGGRASTARLRLEELDESEWLEGDEAAGCVLVRGRVDKGLARGVVEGDGAGQGRRLLALEQAAEEGSHGR